VFPGAQSPEGPKALNDKTLKTLNVDAPCCGTQAGKEPALGLRDAAADGQISAPAPLPSANGVMPCTRPPAERAAPAPAPPRQRPSVAELGDGGVGRPSAAAAADRCCGGNAAAPPAAETALGLGRPVHVFDREALVASEPGPRCALGFRV
jgi:hypothetical protein